MNTKPCFIGFDCGTMGTKVALYDVDGMCLAEAFSENQFSYPHPGWVEMDAMAFFENIVTGITECLEKSGVPGSAVKGISSSGIVDGTVPVDDDFNPVGPFIPYLDMRAQEEAAQIRETCEPIWVEQSGKTGIGPDCVPMVMRWLYKNNVPYAQKAKKFVNISPFVTGKLGGFKAKDAYVDWSMASGWLVGFDLEKNDWSEEQFKMFEIPMDVLPNIVAPWQVVGTVCEDVARRTGLKAGTPLVAGAGDLMVSSLGAGVVETGTAFDVAGTASIMTFITDDISAAVNNKVLVTSKHVFKEQLCLWGCLSSGGFSRGWYRDGILNLKGISGAYPMMDSLAATVPAGSENLLFAPYLTGTMTPSWPDAKGTFMGLTPTHNQAHIWRSMMESVAYEYLMFMRSLEKQGVYYDRVIGVGGGAKSNIWNQIKADMFNTPYTLISTQDTGALGNCVIAAHGAGYVSDMVKTVKEWSKEVRTFTPRPEYNEYYNKIYDIREEIFNGPLDEIFKMWSRLEAIKAPK